MMMKMIVMTAIIKMKRVLLHLNIIMIIYKILKRFFVFGKYKRLLSRLKVYNETHQIIHLIAYECLLRFNC